SHTFHEGDLADLIGDLGGLTGYYVASLAGPLSAMFQTVKTSLIAGAWGSDVEQRLLHADEIRKVLPRDSSALVLIAAPETCDEFVDLFESYDPVVIRRDVASELQMRLEELHRRLVQQATQTAEGAPATH